MNIRVFQIRNIAIAINCDSILPRTTEKIANDSVFRLEETEEMT